MRRSHRDLILVVLAGAGVLGVALAARADDLSRFASRPLHVGGRRAPGPAGAPATGTGSFPDARPVYHNSADLVCSDCHISHASQSHYLDPASPRPGEQVPYTGTPNSHLLKAGDPLDLCLTCHDGQTFAPDVLDADANGLAQRSGGFFGLPEVLNPNGHDLGRNLPTGGGFGLCMRCHFSSGDEMKVTCTDCHNPHGNMVARNLQWASDPEGTPDLGLFVNPTAGGLQRYEAANVTFGTLNSGALREATNICIDCHHVFTGGTYIDPDGDDIHNRHPAYESERSSTNSIAQGEAEGTTVPAHWEGGAGSGFTGASRLRFVNSGATSFATAGGVDAATNGVFCLTCHRAHGSDQAFGLAWPIGATGYGATTCDQCHLVAGAP